MLAKICKPSEKEIIINYEVIDGTAKAGIDFELSEAKPLTLKIPAGQISAKIEIPIIRDDIDEEDEYFTINFLSTSENTILTNDKIDVFIENSPNHQNPLEITKVIYLKELQEFKLTWSSNPEPHILFQLRMTLKLGPMIQLTWSLPVVSRRHSVSIVMEENIATLGSILPNKEAI